MEVVITTSILMIVMTAILSTLEVATRQERRTSAVVDNQNNVMNAFNRITRELRGANPIVWDTVIDSSEFENSITIWVGSVDQGDRKQWRFGIDPATSELLAECLTNCVPQGSGLADAPTREVLVPRMVNTATEPLFRYYSGFSESDALTTTSGAGDQVDPEQIGICTIRIVVRIRSAAQGAAPVYDASTDTEIRNSIPGGVGGWPGGQAGQGC